MLFIIIYLIHDKDKVGNNNLTIHVIYNYLLNTCTGKTLLKYVKDKIEGFIYLKNYGFYYIIKNCL